MGFERNRRNVAVALLVVAAAISATVVSVTPAVAAATSPSPWAVQANKVCLVWLARVKKEFGSPVKPAQLYSFAVKAKTLESQELSALEQISGRPAAGTAALAAVRVDIVEIGSAITVWNQGRPALFVQILKRYLNDERARSAFAAAGATRCG